MVVVTEAATAGVVMTMAAKAVMKAMGRVGMALIVAAMDCRGGRDGTERGKAATAAATAGMGAIWQGSHRRQQRWQWQNARDGGNSSNSDEKDRDISYGSREATVVIAAMTAMAVAVASVGKAGTVAMEAGTWQH